MAVWVSDLSSSSRTTTRWPRRPPRALTSSAHSLIELTCRPAGSAYWPVWEMAPPNRTSLFGRWSAPAVPVPRTRSAHPARRFRIARIVMVHLLYRSCRRRGRSRILLQSWIERITQAVTEEVEAQHGDKDRDRGKQ